MPGNRPHHTDKWRSCVQKVDEKGTGNAYAICTAQLGPSIESREERVRKQAMATLKVGMDDADGDRGDVAEPATKMPRSNGHSGVPGGLTPAPPLTMASRCALCGQPMSVRDVAAGGTQCCDCADGHPRPGGGVTRPIHKPMQVNRVPDGSGHSPLTRIKKRPALKDKKNKA